VYYLGVDKWVAADDLAVDTLSPAPAAACDGAPGPCRIGYITAIMRKLILLVPETYLFGSDAVRETARVQHINPPCAC